MSIQGYDQWKTATPYDDEPDIIEEAQAFLKANEERRKADPEIERACLIIEILVNEI